MKNLILGITTLLVAASANAHMIVGTPMKEETLKTEIYVNTVKSTCKVKIDKVFNLKEEDSYGNPAYKIWVNVNLQGNDVERKLKVKYKWNFSVTNLYTVANDRTEVRDYEYFSPEGLSLKMGTNGRLTQATFVYNKQNVTCSF